MNKIQESVKNFIELENTRYHFIFTQNRKKSDITLDFRKTDYRHASGIHYLTDIEIERNPAKFVEEVLKDNSKITDEVLSKSKKYKTVSLFSGSVEERISDIRFIEECLDSSDFIRIYKTQIFGSFINAEYFIETYSKTLKTNVYIFIRKRNESDNYVIVSFFRKKIVFQGISTYWLLKEKFCRNSSTELYRNKSYK